MKKNFTLLTLFLVSLNLCFAQGKRYLEPVFDNVVVQEDVIYAANATVLLLPQTFSQMSICQRATQ